jgi:hypothetical protein
MAERETVAPTPGAATPAAIDQAHMVVESSRELPNEETFDARQGGRIMTKAFEEDETRPQDLHGSVNYQKETSSAGKPRFVSYTELTDPNEAVRG